MVLVCCRGFLCHAWFFTRVNLLNPQTMTQINHLNWPDSYGFVSHLGVVTATQLLWGLLTSMAVCGEVPCRQSLSLWWLTPTNEAGNLDLGRDQFCQNLSLLNLQLQGDHRFFSTGNIPKWHGSRIISSILHVHSGNYKPLRHNYFKIKMSPQFGGHETQYLGRILHGKSSSLGRVYPWPIFQVRLKS